MPALHNPLIWLAAHAKPSWTITLRLRPFHHDAEDVGDTVHTLAGSEAHKIHKLIEDYESYTLPILSNDHGEDFWLACPFVSVSKPRTNGGHIHFSMVYDQHEDSWFGSSHETHKPPNPKDKVISWENAEKESEERKKKAS